MAWNDYVVACDPRTSDLQPGFYALYRAGDSYSGGAAYYAGFRVIEHHGLRAVKRRLGSEVHRLWSLLPGGQWVGACTYDSTPSSTLYVYDPEDD